MTAIHRWNYVGQPIPTRAADAPGSIGDRRRRSTRTVPKSHAPASRRRRVLVDGALQFRDARPLLADSLARGQASQDDRFGAQPVQAAGLRFAEFAALRGVDQRRCLTRLGRPWLHARLHHSSAAHCANCLF